MFYLNTSELYLFFLYNFEFIEGDTLADGFETIFGDFDWGDRCFSDEIFAEMVRV